ncbi:MAG TPA: TSUP family transporter [Kofleriaceae bacterium]|nr:TSUP family transporter [Kofleriaceae bacterium]
MTVPTMLLVGMSPTTAIATNMLGFFCLSPGATVPFARTKRLHTRPTIGLALGAIPGSVVGALVAVAISAAMLRSLIAVAMLVMAVIVVAMRPSPRSRVSDSSA